jgi:hypothetical protein
MKLNQTVKSTLVAAVVVLAVTAARASSPSIPSFVKVGKSYLITLPTTVDKDRTQIVEIVSAAGGGWFRVISYPIRDTATKSPAALTNPTEKWVNFAQVVTVTEAATNKKAR